MHTVITGANRGIGNAIYQGYLARGDTVTGTARTKSGYFPLDVTKEDDFAKLASHLDQKPIDCLVCNAGVYLDKGHTIGDGYAAKLWSDAFAANVTGVFLTIKTLLPNLKRARNPKIAIISSQMASQTNAPGGSYIYRASKAAALNLGRNLATDLKVDGIAVGIYHPGWVSTDMGGETAEITVDQSADGLIERFDELSLDSTGCFRTWDGKDHVF
jgi:NAD(P)-dependent dehydrogenase (short-subunit alcohol dehydrogenase family)